MNTKPWDATGSARKALHGIVADPQYGAAALSQPAVMSNLLKDLLPDEPREASLLVAAAQANLAGTLRGYLTQGLDPGTAVSLTAHSFVSSTSHTQEACTWVVGELAVVLGLDPAPPGQAAAPPPGQGQPTLTAAVNAAFSQATPPYAAASPAQPGYAAPGSPWQSPWAVPARPAHPARGGSIAAALTGLAGALLVLIACFVPYERYPGSSSFGILLGHRGLPASYTFWYAAEPIGVMLVAVAVAIGLIATGGSARLNGLLPGMLIAFGFQTTLLFGGYIFTILPSSYRQAGGAIGFLGGLVLLAAGVVGLIAMRRATPAAGTASAPGPTVPGAPGA